MLIPVVSTITRDHTTGGSDVRAEGAQPLAFVPNRGQMAAEARYQARGAGFGFYFTHHKAVLAFEKGGREQVLELRFVGASRHTRLVPAKQAPGKVNYLVGGSSSRWHTGLPTYTELRYRNLWPGIDMLFHGRGPELEYSFLVRPGAHVSDIRLAYGGAEGVGLTKAGDLRLETALGTLTDSRPRSYQRIGGHRVVRSSSFTLGPRGTVGFAVKGHDVRRSLLIDPGLVYSTYLGGAGADVGWRVSADSAGNAYVYGEAEETDFPTTPGAYDRTLASRDRFVTKLDPSGTLVYSTYIGGSGVEAQGSMAVDAAGNAYIATSTYSTDFPTTPGTDRTLNGPSDVGVAKLNAAGSGLVYGTYIGGSAYEGLLYGLAVDQSGSAYVAGGTSSSDFPVTSGAPDVTAAANEGFVAKLAPDGKSLSYATYLGGSDNDVPWDIAVSNGNAYVTGQTSSTDFPTTPGAFQSTHQAYEDGFVTKLNAAGNAFAYSTLLAGDGGEQLNGITADSSGNAYVTGWSGSLDYPTTPGAFDTNGEGDLGVVTKLNPSGNALVFSTFLGSSGGGGGTDPEAIALDGNGNVLVTGNTGQPIAVTPDAYQGTSGGAYDAFLLKLTRGGDGLVYGTYLGGSDYDSATGIALDGQGNVVLAGATGSTDFPTTAGAFQQTYAGGTDGFVTKLALPPVSGYPRPRGATPLLAYLVPAYDPCTTPNLTHGPPLSFGSCSPPVQASTNLTTGTPDANGLPANFAGYVRLVMQQYGWAGAPDLGVTVVLKDLRCKVGSSSSGCWPDSVGRDYTGPLWAVLHPRITDRDNGSGGDAATVQDSSFAVPVYCQRAGGASTGAYCQAYTSVNAVLDGSIKGGNRTIWELGPIEVTDGGPDHDIRTEPNQAFARQGVFVP